MRQQKPCDGWKGNRFIRLAAGFAMRLADELPRVGKRTVAFGKRSIIPRFDFASGVKRTMPRVWAICVFGTPVPQSAWISLL